MTYFAGNSTCKGTCNSCSEHFISLSTGGSEFSILQQLSTDHKGILDE